MGAAFDMGGKAAPLGGLLDEKGFVGAALAIGGKAELDNSFAAGLLSSVLGGALNGLGAAFDMGGNAALLDEDDVSFDVATLNEKPPLPIPVDAGTSVLFEPPNEKPDVAAPFVSFSASFFSDDEAPPNPPNENPPEPMPLELVVVAPPNENPPAPILLPAAAAVAVVLDSDD